ncbi:MAG: hypothetical protein ABFD20_00695 [Anaerolineales bacterium]
MRQFDLPLLTDRWPAWAKSELERERQRRAFNPTYGIDGGRLAYTPYRRETDNQTYRRSNQIYRKRPTVSQRQGADNLFYSPVSDWLNEESDYTQLWESMPDELRGSLRSDVELKVVLRDALRALPLVSQRALRAMVEGIAVRDIALAEGLAEQTIVWLIESAKERLRDILQQKLGGDDGQRFVE